MTDSKQNAEMKKIQIKVYALFFVLFVTFSFPYIASADTSVNGFFRENLVSSSVFEQNKDFSLDIKKAKARKLIKTNWRKSRKALSFEKHKSGFGITNASYVPSFKSSAEKDSFAID